ncbi:MAG: hypothetical protein ACREPX_00685, partial [Rhodanobacteraceae bacterium]
MRVTDKKIADMRRGPVGNSGALLACHRDSEVRNLDLREMRGATELLDNVAIRIARRKIHARVNVRRISAQDLLD